MADHLNQCTNKASTSVFTSQVNLTEELMESIYIRIFLLIAEEYYRAPMKEQMGTLVSCDNMGALHTFAKECKRVPASSSNTDTRRALREVDRLALNKYSLEHVKGHQYRTARAEDLR